MLSDEQLIKIIEENGRMKNALHSIAAYASQATFGSWRHHVYQLSRLGLAIPRDAVVEKK